MLSQTDHSDAEISPDTLTPLCDEAEFTELVGVMVANEAPRLFAVLLEYGERADGRIAAWGMAFSDHTEVVEVDHGLHLRLQSPESATRMLGRRPLISARVVWVNSGLAGSGSHESAEQG